MSSGPDRKYQPIVLGLLFVLGGLALAIVGELASSPLQQALQELPLELTAALLIVLLAVAVVATIAYERLARGASDEDAEGPGQEITASSQSRIWRPSRRIVTGLTAVVALAAVGLLGVTNGPRLFERLAGAVTAAIMPPWTSESLHTFLPPATAGSPGRPTAVFSLDGTKLAVSEWTRTVQIRDLESDHRTVLRVGEPPEQIAFSPDGDTLALVGERAGVDCGGMVELWDLETQQLVAERQRPETFLHAVAFSPDGKSFALGGKDCESRDGVVEVWNTDGVERTQHFTHGQEVRKVAFGPEGDTLASAGGQQWDSGVSYTSIRLWDVERGGKPIATMEQPANFPVDDFGFAPSGRSAVSAGTFWTESIGSYGNSSELLTVWETEPPRALISAESENLPIDALALSPDGNTVAVARKTDKDDGPQRIVELRRTRSLEKFESFEVGSSSVYSIDFDDSGRRIAIATYDGVELWTRRGG